MSDIGMDLYLAYEDGYKAGYAEAERKVKCKPRTNADRIRAMTEEELARFIQRDICDIIDIDHCFRHGVCLDCVIDWLRKEADDESAV